MKVFCERIDPDGFFGEAGIMLDIELSSSHGFAEMHPVCRFVTGAVKAGDFYKRFQQHRPVTILLQKAYGLPSPIGGMPSS